jgi:phosphoribosylformylglycinamidine (FGAM) synthase PurS component
VLDPQGIAISTAADYQWSPALAFDGENFLVAWTDRRGVDNTDIYGARVTPAGVVLDPAGVAISTATGNQESPAVAASGESLFVVWRDSRSGPYTYDVYGARVTPAGVVLDPQGIAISTATGNQREPALAFDGTNLLVAWNDGRNGGYDIYGARVTPAGVVLDAQGIAISTTPGYGGPALAFDGENSLVVWEDERYGGYGDIYGTQVTPAGVVLDPEGIAISTAAEGQVYPALAFDGENFLAVWQGWYSNDIYGARVTPAGGVLDPSGILISTAAGYPALAFGGENFLVTWSYGYDIYGARVTPAGGVLDPQGIVISTAADGEYPVPAFDGENFLVVWGDIRSDSWDIYGARVTPAGIVLDPSGFPISTAFEGQLYPAIAFGEENFFAVWEDRRSETDNIYGARVTPAGAVLDPAGIAISSDVNSDERNPILGFDGENFLVVWHDLFGTHPSGLYGARVTPAGAVLDPNGIPISTATGYQYFPALAFDGTNFLAVWEDLRSGSDIYGARVTPAGVVFDSGPVVRQEGSQSCPALARGSGNDMFLVYQGWAGSVGGKTYNTQRIWGKMNPRPAVAEMTKPEARMTSSGAAIIRGVLFTPASGVEHEASSILLDICGRKVRELVPGANDVRALAPGVYFVRWRDSRGQGVEDSRVTKVVIQR